MTRIRRRLGGVGGFMLQLQLVAVVVALHFATASFAANVTYDHRALLIDGRRRLLVSGAIHYPRSTPEMWPDLIQKSKEGGLDMIDTYVFWSLHEPVRGQYDYTGRKDLVKFIRTVADAGLYVHLRIGPYVCAEWNYGGFPLWLHFIPGIKFRTNNGPFKKEMHRFTAYIVDLMKKNSLYASQGGPIILSQIENEYGDIDAGYGAAAKPYINWAAKMALSLDTGVPWVMCVEKDAPDPIINTCNGFYCDQFTPNSNQKPKLWTENYSGWFTSFGDPIPYRPSEDLAFAVARFFQRGGTMQNYYMYHGGTNFGRSTGGPFVTTTYDYDAPINEYGIAHQPKWGHLKELHKAIKLCEAAMVATDPVYSSLGPKTEATVYKTDSGLCAAFLANTDSQSDKTVNFHGKSYRLPAWSVSILPDCKNVVFNTAKINSVVVLPKYIPQTLSYDVDNHTNRISASRWKWFKEPVGISKANAFVKPGLFEQINTTADKSDYLWYSISIDITGNEPFLQNESQAVLHVDSLGHGLHVFINGMHEGAKFGNSNNANVSIDVPVTLKPGKNAVDLLSLTVGLQNYGAFFDIMGAGITGPVTLKSSAGSATIDLSSQQWTYQVGLEGEDLRLGTGGSSRWDSSPIPKNQPLTWYKTSFAAPDGVDPVALDLTGMAKGEAWVNGQSIGRYWPTYIASIKGCTDSCNYRGNYQSRKCLKNCGKPSQQFYHVPRSWLKPNGNVLVVFEEIGGDSTHISFASRQTGSICSHVSDSHPPPVDAWGSDQETGKTSGPVLSLECPSSDQVITSIKFASFGTPDGACGSFIEGKCRSSSALGIIQNACIGSQSCSIGVSIDTLGDPCRGVQKSLAVEAVCT